MNGLRQRMLLLGLLVAAVPMAFADPPAEPASTVPVISEMALAAPPAIDAFSSAQPEPLPASPVGETRSADGAEAVAASEAASNIIKVSRLEPELTVSAPPPEDRQLEQRKADFLKFAGRKLKDMNRNHILSRDRMRIEKRPGGGYMASFHQLDDSSMSCQVSRSTSKGAQYVAVLSYKERVYTASCSTPADCRQGEFAPAEVIPNRHIFVYNNGVWQ